MEGVEVHASRPGHLLCGLRGRVAPFPGLDGVLCADEIALGGLHIHTDDIIFHGAYICVVLAYLVAHATAHSPKWRQSSRRTLCVAAECGLAQAWRQEPDGTFTVIRL